MYNALIVKHLDYIISKCTGNNKHILVYKGFPLRFMKELSETFPFISNENDRMTNEKIDLKKIYNNSQGIVKKIINNVLEDISVLLYEEFYLLSHNFNISLFDGKFILITNDLYSDYPNQTNSSI